MPARSDFIGHMTTSSDFRVLVIQWVSKPDCAGVSWPCVCGTKFSVSPSNTLLKMELPLTLVYHIVDIHHFFPHRTWRHFCPFWPQTPSIHHNVLVSRCQLPRKVTLASNKQMELDQTQKQDDCLMIESPSMWCGHVFSLHFLCRLKRGNPTEEQRRQPNKCMKQSLFLILHICT